MVKKKAKKKKKEKKKEKPVGEILKEEGIIKDLPEPQHKELPSEESSSEFSKLLMKIEKIEASTNMLKDLDSERDERINELSENIGEIRSLLFQRDATIRETVSKVEKLEDTVKDINPEKIEKIMEKRDKEIEKTLARLEKIEVIETDLSKKVRKSEKILDNIKSMENLSEIVKDIEDKVSEMKEIRDSTKRDAAKTERFYIEMGKRLDDFDKMKEEIKKLDELTKELMRSIDENKIQLDSKVSKEDVEKSLKEVLKAPQSNREDKIKEIEQRKSDITGMLKSLEKQKKEGLISESAYQEIYEKNKILIDEINKELLELESEEEPKNLADWLSIIEDKTKKIDKKLSLYDVKREDLEKKISDITSELSALKDAISQITEKMNHYTKNIEELSKSKPEPIIIKAEPIKLQKLLDKKEEIKIILDHIEDEYRKGVISTKTYKEIKTKNLKELEKIEKQITSGEVEELKNKESGDESEVNKLEKKIDSLEGEKKEELKSLLELAKEKMNKGYPLLSKKYINQIKKELEDLL